MSKQPAVSVLVPCYNVERYVRQCLDSLVNQTLKNIEIICINDGSTDSTLQILQEYADRDSRIVIIDKPNSGYGASMNLGIEKARGRYIGITESDDFASPEMFQLLYTAAAVRNLDIAKSNFFYHRDDEDFYVSNHAGIDYFHVFDPAEKPQVITTIPSIWAAIYSRKMLDRKRIRFRETPGASFQDTAFVFKCWFAAKRALLLHRPLLHYRVDNPNSSVKSTTKIYEPCQELDSAHEFLTSLGQSRKAAFANIFTAQRFRTYQWNYERIAPEFHKDFAEYMVKDIEAAKVRGEFDEESFPEDLRAPLHELLSDIDSFVASHPDRF